MKHKSKKRTRQYIKKLRKSKKRTRKYNKSNKIKYKKRMNYKSAKKRFKTRRYKRNARKHYKKGGAPTLEQLNQKLIRKEQTLDYFKRKDDHQGIAELEKEIRGLKQKIREEEEEEEVKAAIAAVEAAKAEQDAAAEAAAAAAAAAAQQAAAGAAAEAAAKAEQDAAAEAAEAAAAAAQQEAAAAGPGAAEVEVDPHEGQSLHNSEATLVYTDPIGGGKLYLGGVTPGTDKKFLKSIKTIITIMEDPPLTPSETIEYYERKCNGQPYKLYITYSDEKSQERWIIPINDANGRLTSYFNFFSNVINSTINQMGKNVLVHCSSGVSRSSTLVIAYLMIKQKMTLRDAYRYVYERRNIILPGIDFFKELMALDSKIHRENSMGLEEYYAYIIKNNVDMIIPGNISLDICLSKLKQKYPQYSPDTLTDVQIYGMIEELIEELTQ